MSTIQPHSHLAWSFSVMRQVARAARSVEEIDGGADRRASAHPTGGEGETHSPRVHTSSGHIHCRQIRVQ